MDKTTILNKIRSGISLTGEDQAAILKEVERRAPSTVAVAKSLLERYSSANMMGRTAILKIVEPFLTR